ncbi:MAG: nitroreductase family protein [Prevotellaceae bacterium]|jgi:nitroreductase|nr:nitroreductase family protein [Prevotellaceae bacterium]
METLFSHRSIRKFKAKAVEEDIVNFILEAGMRASNTGNMQAYSIVCTADEALLRELAPCHFNQPASKAPVQLTFCADFNRFSKWCRQRNAEPGYDNFLSFLVGMTDALLAAQNCCIAAEEKGLGICYLGTTLYKAEAIIDILNLPLGVVPVITVVMGYPDEEPELVDRLPLYGVVHRERYHDYSEEEIDKIYAEKEALPSTANFIRENRKDTLAQIFTDNRYPKAVNEDISKTLLAVLAKQGFMNNGK